MNNSDAELDALPMASPFPAAPAENQSHFWDSFYDRKICPDLGYIKPIDLIHSFIDWACLIGLIFILIALFVSTKRFGWQRTREYANQLLWWSSGLAGAGLCGFAINAWLHSRFGSDATDPAVIIVFIASYRIWCALDWIADIATKFSANYFSKFK